MSKRAPLPYHLSFNAQHSPMGAFMSFTCGNFGTRGGIGLQIGQPGDQEVFIGFKDGDYVKQGQRLFIIDPRPYQAALELAAPRARILLSTNCARLNRLQKSKRQPPNSAPRPGRSSGRS